MPSETSEFGGQNTWKINTQWISLDFSCLSKANKDLRSLLKIVHIYSIAPIYMNGYRYIARLEKASMQLIKLPFFKLRFVIHVHVVNICCSAEKLVLFLLKKNTIRHNSHNSITYSSIGLQIIIVNNFGMWIRLDTPVTGSFSGSTQ